MYRIRKFTSCYARLFRAEEHLESFEEEMRAFLHTNPLEIVREVNRDGTQYVYRVRENARFPLRLCVIVGDCLHNLRSCLDHLAWEMAGRPLGRKAERIEFPIFDDRADYPKAVRRKLAGVPDRAKVIIERLQPYHAFDAAISFGPPLLSVLYHLSNFDKHRHIHIVGTLPRHLYGTFEEMPLEQKFSEGHIAKDGREVARFTFARPNVDMDMTVDWVSCFLVHDLNGKLVPISYLRGTFQFIRDHILPQFHWLDD